MLEAFDLRSSRDAGELAGCSHHTVAAYVARRDEGRLGGAGPVRRERIIDPWMAKIEEWVERSCGKIRADRCYAKLKALGFEGSDRTVRRAVAACKNSFAAGRRRVYRPWIAEPEMWAQWDWGAGPVRRAKDEVLCVAGVVEVPGGDRDLGPHPPTVIACVDRAMRAFGGAPTYWLTDNERTVTIDHVAGIAVRHPEIVAVGGHYGITVATCVPADPESKGGSEPTVRVAKADLVPTDANLATTTPAGPSWSMRARRGWPRSTAVASGDPAATGRDAHRGTASAARAARTPIHGGARGNPESLLELHDQLRRGDLLGPAHPRR